MKQVVHLVEVIHGIATIRICPARLIRGSGVVVSTPMVALRGCSTSTTAVAMPTSSTGGVLWRWLAKDCKS